MKIVYFSDQYWPVISGVSVSIDSFKESLTKKGHQVYLFVTDYPGAREYDEKKGNDNVYRFKSYSLFFNRENRLVKWSERSAIFSALDEIKPDIIHAHTEFTMFKFALCYSRLRRVPLVITAHTNWEQLIHLYIKFMPKWFALMYCRFKLRRTFNRANAVIVPTSLMEVLLETYSVEKPISVIPTGINPDDFTGAVSEKKKNRLALEKQYPSLKGKKILFSLGRLGMEKNITLLMDITGKINKKRGDTMLVIAGDGPAKDELEKYAASMGLQDLVIFTGYIARERVKDYYSAADVFVFASKVESQGMVVLEAMSCGLPVVAIGKMGTREVMGGDSGGFMVDDDEDQFEEKVLNLLDDRDLHRKKSAEALSHAAKWGIIPMADRIMKIYESLVRKL